MKKIRRFHLFISLSLSLLILFSQNSCMYYRKVPVTYPEFYKGEQASQPLDYFFYIVQKTGSENDTYKVWALSDLLLTSDEFSGSLIRLDPQRAKEITVDHPKNPRTKDSYEILFYISDTCQLPAQSATDSLVTIPLSDLVGIEIYKVDVATTMIATTLMVFSTAALVAGIIFVIALVTKDSCPFVYCDNPEGLKLQGEIFSGATFPSLERHDYLFMEDLRPDSGSYKLRITNEVKEIQHINLAELLVIDHPLGTTVLFDKNGKAQMMGDIQPPVSCTSLEGGDALEAVRSRDGKTFIGVESKGLEDGLIATFNKPEKATKARLVVCAKNTFWGDYVFHSFHSQLGSYYPTFYGIQSKRPADALRKWSTDQKLPLQVSMKQGGKWVRCGELNIAGPLALRQDVMELDLPDDHSPTVEIKLESGYLFWEIDRLAMDFSFAETVNVITVPLSTAVDEQNRDISVSLKSDDDLYYDQPEIGNAASVAFEVPVGKPGMDRSVFLHSKGFYKIIVDNDHKADFRWLAQFRKPMALSRFSRDLLKIYKQKGFSYHFNDNQSVKSLH